MTSVKISSNATILGFDSFTLDFEKNEDGQWRLSNIPSGRKGAKYFTRLLNNLGQGPQHIEIETKEPELSKVSHFLLCVYYSPIPADFRFIRHVVEEDPEDSEEEVVSRYLCEWQTLEDMFKVFGKKRWDEGKSDYVLWYEVVRSRRIFELSEVSDKSFAFGDLDD